MIIEEIFSQIGQHMIEGLMIHSQMADYYAFLGFMGFSKCHEYHFFEENLNYKKLANYYMNHYHKLLLERRFNNPNIIPEGWYQHTRGDVSLETKKAYIEAGFKKWIDWERQTKTFYQQQYQALVNLGEIAGALEVAKYIQDVSDELAQAEIKHLEYTGMQYSLTDIILEQDKLYKKYSKQLKGIFKDA